ERRRTRHARAGRGAGRRALATVVPARGRREHPGRRGRDTGAATVSALPIVVIGGGQAGFTLVDTLRTRGYDGPIMLVEATSELPYQRPPLSKAYLAGTAGDEDLPFRPTSYYAQHDIDLRLGQRLIGIDERRGVAELSTGETVAYRDLVLATGS